LLRYIPLIKVLPEKTTKQLGCTKVLLQHQIHKRVKI
jgi:hypothetical protein